MYLRQFLFQPQQIKAQWACCVDMGHKIWGMVRMTTLTVYCGEGSLPLSFFAEDQLDRDFVETEFVADLIHQIALIGKMDAFGLGDKENIGCD